MTSGFPPYKWYSTPAQVGIDLKETAPKSCDVYTSSVLHYETKGIRINPLLLDDFEFSSHLFYVFMDLNTYCLGLSEINFDNSQTSHPGSGHSSYGDHIFLEPPEIQNSNWESLQTNQSFVTLDQKLL